MATGDLLASDSLYQCTKCERQVEIFNGDRQLSMELHNQLHQPEDTTVQEILTQITQNTRHSIGRSKPTDYHCPVCLDSFEVLNSDLEFSLKLHLQKHKSRKSPECSLNEMAGCSSSKTNNTVQSQNISCEIGYYSKEISILDNVFNLMHHNLKSHKGFIFENENGKAFCCVCKVSFEKVFEICHHLRTKIHEDNIILSLKEKLSDDLYHELDFVSFYDSNLYCNLCSCSVDLKSKNVHETIVNIITHNASKTHSSQKSYSTPSCQYDIDKAYVFLKYLSSISQLFSGNEHLIECRVQPQYKCKLCCVFITYDENEEILLQNFISHFSSSSHNKCVNAASVLTLLHESNSPGKMNHNPLNQKPENSLDVNVKTTNYKENTCSKQAPNLQDPSSSFAFDQNLGLVMENDPVLWEELSKLFVEYGDGEHCMCTLCGDPIENSFNLESFKQNVSVHIQSHHVPRINMLSQTKKNEISVIKKLFDTLPPELLKEIKFIQPDENNKQLLVCTICKNKICCKHLEKHLKGSAHVKSVQKFNIEKFISTSATCLVKKNKRYMCTICEIKLSMSSNERLFIKNVESHLNGKKHLKKLHNLVANMLDKLQLSNSTIRKNSHFVQIHDLKLECTLCKFTVPFVDKEEDLTRKLLLHFTGETHLHASMIYESTKGTCTIEKVQSKSHEEIKESFKTLPQCFQEDFIYIKSSSTEGYISCTLCNSMFIPRYLRTHLEGENHKKEKSLNHSAEDYAQAIIGNQQGIKPLGQHQQ